MQVCFSIIERSVPVSETCDWQLVDFTPEILEYCLQHGVLFEENELVLEVKDQQYLNGSPVKPDRSTSAPGERSASARSMSHQFAMWTYSLAISSTHRSRHPETQRYTYSRSGTFFTLDDIYISSEHESAIAASAVWLNSIWRPITVQSAFANRLFLVVKSFVDRGIPNSILQHGFRNDRSVIDAALLTTFLVDRAKETFGRLPLLSKDCLKCSDKIPSWVKELLYMGIGVPVTVRKLMIDLLRPGTIEIRTALVGFR
ncbi:hypothetical protein PHMEG_0008025 [Phytophthora megakarya]|uniref:Uncharacterized protein n=1 Tax=Phytophthora megakarya TaxID=4795 RepID=A0A225WK00_9STRA|nr:hypothetical protein PHMEG_0008025 [Phytophthora megakarya]